MSDSVYILKPDKIALYTWAWPGVNILHGRGHHYSLRYRSVRAIIGDGPTWLAGYVLAVVSLPI
jgi:hypothetical protein